MVEEIVSLENQLHIPAYWYALTLFPYTIPPCDHAGIMQCISLAACQAEVHQQTHNQGTTMKHLLKNLRQYNTGATLVEYAVIVALISVAAIGIIATVGGQVASVFSNVSEQLANATDGGGSGSGPPTGGFPGSPPAQASDNVPSGFPGQGAGVNP